MSAGWKIVVGGAILVLAAFLWGGRYTVTQQNSRAYVVDRFTGAVRVCDLDECRTLPTDQSTAAKDEVAKDDKMGGFTRVDPTSGLTPDPPNRVPTRDPP